MKSTSSNSLQFKSNDDFSKSQNSVFSRTRIRRSELHWPGKRTDSDRQAHCIIAKQNACVFRGSGIDQVRSIGRATASHLSTESTAPIFFLFIILPQFA